MQVLLVVGGFPIEPGSKAGHHIATLFGDLFLKASNRGWRDFLEGQVSKSTALASLVYGHLWGGGTNQNVKSKSNRRQFTRFAPTFEAPQLALGHAEGNCKSPVGNPTTLKRRVSFSKRCS